MRGRLTRNMIQRVGGDGVLENFHFTISFNLQSFNLAANSE